MVPPVGVEPTSPRTSEFETDAYASSARAACNENHHFSKNNSYPRPDLNRHARRQQILSLRCLPFHHVGIKAEIQSLSAGLHRISGPDGERAA